ncbi:CRAL/TRIO domain-containing protein [Phthorimaea operculella]|nr:CRAL/TRIO domain-containing protein [Phthorimaea operculella]
MFYCGDETRLKQDVEILKSWIMKQNHFVVRDFEPAYLERYLITNKGSIERAKSRFDRLCTLRTLLPELAQDFDIKNEFAGLWRCTRQCVLPKPTKDHYRVIISQVYNGEDHGKAELLHFYRLSIYFEYMLLHDYTAGIEFIMDNRNMSLGLLAKMSPIVMSKFYAFAEAYGFRLKALHIISNSWMLETVASIMTKGMSDKLSKRIQIHSSVETLQRFIPREALPVDYGGEEKNIQELSASFVKEISSDQHMARMDFISEAKTDESKRLTCTFNEEYLGMPGSFKTLCVD